MSPNQATPAEKSIRFSPLAAAQPLSILSPPETLNASGSRRACRMAISRNASSLPDFPEFAQAVRYGFPGTPGPSAQLNSDQFGGLVARAWTVPAGEVKFVSFRSDGHPAP